MAFGCRAIRCSLHIGTVLNLLYHQQWFPHQQLRLFFLICFSRVQGTKLCGQPAIHTIQSLSHSFLIPQANEAAKGLHDCQLGNGQGRVQYGIATEVPHSVAPVSQLNNMYTIVGFLSVRMPMPDRLANVFLLS